MKIFNDPTILSATIGAIALFSLAIFTGLWNYARKMLSIVESNQQKHADQARVNDTFDKRLVLQESRMNTHAAEMAQMRSEQGVLSERTQNMGHRLDEIKSDTDSILKVMMKRT